MKNLKDIILERLHITKDTKVNQFTDEELRNDWNEVRWASTKAEKQAIANKYDCKIIKIDDIQKVIAELLRENRKTKEDFTKEDINDFHKLTVAQRYKQLKPFLEQESDLFVEYLYNYYCDYCKQHKCKYRKFGGSYADNTRLEIRDSLLQYLKEKHIIS